MAYLGEPYDETYFLNNHEGGYTDYGTMNPAIFIAQADDIEAQLGPVSGIRVLEIGCAFGFLTKELADRGAIIDSVDISAYAVAEAQSRFPSLSFLQADAAIALPFSDNTFQLVVVCGVMECMPDRQTFMSLFREILRVLQPGGGAYILAYETANFGYRMLSRDEWVALAIPDWIINVDRVNHLPLSYDLRIMVT